MEILSIVIFGRYVWNWFELVEKIPGITGYIEANYSAIKQCSRDLRASYGNANEGEFFAIYSIPDCEKTVLEVAVRCGVALP